MWTKLLFWWRKALHLLRANPLSPLQQNLLRSMLSAAAWHCTDVPVGILVSFATGITVYKQVLCHIKKHTQKPKASFSSFLAGSIKDTRETSQGGIFIHIFNAALTLTSCVTTTWTWENQSIKPKVTLTWTWFCWLWYRERSLKAISLFSLA